MPARWATTRLQNVQRRGRRFAGYLLDLTAFFLAAFLAFDLRFDGALPSQYVHAVKIAVFVWAAAKSMAFIVFAVRWGHWRYTSTSDVVRILLANSLGSLLGGTLIYALLGTWGVPRSIYILEWQISCLLTLGARFAVRLVVAARTVHPSGGKQVRTLIYGAGAAGLALVRELEQNESLKYEVVGLLDDDPRKGDLVFQGKRVLGTGESLSKWVEKHRIKQLLIAIPSATGPQMVRILQFATDAKMEYKMVPSLGELLQDADLGRQIRDVAVEDLLGRKARAA